MRTFLRRYGLGSTLCILGLALVLVGTGASLGHQALAGRGHATPDSVTSTLDDRGVALDARLDVDTPLDLPLDTLSVHLSPGAADHAALPTLDAGRDIDLRAAGLGLDADVALATGATRSTSARGGGEVTTASTLATLGPQDAPLALAAAALTFAGALAYFWTSIKGAALRLAPAPLFALYAKISRAQVFDNNVRERIFGSIRANPGLCASDLSRLAGVSWGTTIYHLDVLEQTRMVSSIRNGRYRRYFENGAPLATTKEAVSVLQNAVSAGVVETLRVRPGVTQRELAAATSMTPQALHWHLTRLVATGLVRKEREGRVVRHFAAL